MKKTKRINARITPEVDRKLREIIQSSGSSMSEIIMDAVERYYQQGSMTAAETPYEIAQRFGVIGAFRSGKRNTSTQYKEILRDSLNQKYKSS